MRITLSEWNKIYFDEKPRGSRQLYRYIQDGKIYPAPIKVGRGYLLESYAILLDQEAVSNPNTLMRRINEQKERSKDKRFTA